MSDANGTEQSTYHGHVDIGFATAEITATAPAPTPECRNKRNQAYRAPVRKTEISKALDKIEATPPVHVNLLLRSTVVAEQDARFQQLTAAMGAHEIEYCKAIAFCGGGKVSAVYLIYPDIKRDIAQHAVLRWAKSKCARALLKYLEEAFVPPISAPTKEEIEQRAIEMFRDRKNFKSFGEFQKAVDWIDHVFALGLVKKVKKASSPKLPGLEAAASAGVPSE